MNLFEFLKPPVWRSRAAANPVVNDSTMARVSDSDPLYRAMLDLVQGQAEQAALAALESKLDALDRAYLAGRANAYVALLAELEDWRVRARLDVENRSKKK